LPLGLLLLLLRRESVLRDGGHRLLGGGQLLDRTGHPFIQRDGARQPLILLFADALHLSERTAKLLKRLHHQPGALSPGRLVLLEGRDCRRVVPGRTGDLTVDLKRRPELGGQILLDQSNLSQNLVQVLENLLHLAAGPGDGCRPLSERPDVKVDASRGIKGCSHLRPPSAAIRHVVLVRMGTRRKTALLAPAIPGPCVLHFALLSRSAAPSLLGVLPVLLRLRSSVARRRLEIEDDLVFRLQADPGRSAALLAR